MRNWSPFPLSPKTMLARGVLRPLSLRRSGLCQGRQGAALRAVTCRGVSAVSSAQDAAVPPGLPRPPEEIPGPRRWPLLGSLPALTARKGQLFDF